MQAFKVQEHLNLQNTVNLGSYYTPKHIVDLVYSLLEKHVPSLNTYTALDTSCGYGAFLNNSIFKKNIGGDFDSYAISQAQNHVGNATIFHENALVNISRSKYEIADTENLIIIGNPPYNDTTSLSKKHLKTESFEIDNSIKARDMGISFLLSYNLLNPEYICVLHPLSYLIKKANFSLLREFKQQYKLIDGIVFSSKEFQQTSVNSQFPILIGLYKRDNTGMDFNYIQNFQFITIENQTFSLNQFEYIEKYISKYPSKIINSDILFWTMRDINALNRNQTFITKQSYNAISVPIDKLEYYCYVDTFKDFIKHIPYYFGNLSIPIDHIGFLDIRDEFIKYSLKKHSYLAKYTTISTQDCNIDKIQEYFKKLLGSNYVY